MKFSAAILAAVAGVVVAQGQADLPACAQTCVGQFLTGGQYGGCPGADVKCICSNKNFLGDIACCLAGTCNNDDQAKAVQIAQQLCSGYGVTVPSAVTCSTATGASSSAAASSAAASSTAASSSAAASGSTTVAPTDTTASVAAAATTSSSKNYSPRQTPLAGIGAIGGIVAAVALL